MGLFSNMSVCELGEQKYYIRTGCVWTFIHNYHAHPLWVPEIKGLYRLHVQSVPISAPGLDFLIWNTILISLKQMY